VVFSCVVVLGQYFSYSLPSTDRRPPAGEDTMLIRSPRGRAGTSIALLGSQLMLVLAVLLLCPVGRVTCQGEGRTQSPTQVLQDLLSRYGDNSTISVPQLRSLLALISQGQGDGGGDGGSNVAEAPTINTTPKSKNSSKVRTNLSCVSVRVQAKVESMHKNPPCFGNTFFFFLCQRIEI